MFLRAIHEAVANKKKRKIIFSGRPVEIISFERTTEKEIQALCEQGGRAFRLSEIYQTDKECLDRLKELQRAKKCYSKN